MSEMLYSKVPCVDLADFTSDNPQRKQRFVTTLGDAFQNIGFVALTNHGLSDTLTENLYSSVMRFFDLPDPVKVQYELESMGGQRGYTAKGKEHAKGRTVGDLKEFYHVGQEISETARHRLRYPANLFPTEVPDFSITTIEAYKTLESAGVQILRAIALFLGLDEFYFDEQVRHGNSILRAIHYFPIPRPQDLPVGAVRAAAHGDINLITLLMGASAEGLQLLRKDGVWMEVTALPDQIVVNVGDMLERLTNKKLKSTVHRVVNPPQELLNQPRYSIPFFMHPVSSMDLSCLESCIDKQNPKQFIDITAGDFLTERLREIGLID